MRSLVGECDHYLTAIDVPSLCEQLMPVMPACQLYPTAQTDHSAVSPQMGENGDLWSVVASQKCS